MTWLLFINQYFWNTYLKTLQNPCLTSKNMKCLLSKCVRKYQKTCAEVSMSNKMFALEWGALAVMTLDTLVAATDIAVGKTGRMALLLGAVVRSLPYSWCHLAGGLWVSASRRTLPDRLRSGGQVGQDANAPTVAARLTGFVTHGSARDTTGLYSQ